MRWETVPRPTCPLTWIGRVVVSRSRWRRSSDVSPQLTSRLATKFASPTLTGCVRPSASTGSHEGIFNRGVAFNDWKKNLYDYAWFDTSPEFKAAQAVDDDPNVVVWARLHRGDIPITWTIEGREYNPDLVVIEEIDDQRTCWLVETKMNREMTSAEVIGKRRAALTWANTVNNSGQVDGRWRYLLLSEDDVDDAAGSWTHMKGFGTQ